MQAQAWWRKPVGLRALIWVTATVGALWALAMGAGLWYFYSHWQVAVDVQHQPLDLRLPAGLVARATIDKPVSVPLHVRPEVSLALDQSVRATLDQDLLARVAVHSVLPIDTTVAVRMLVPVQTTLQMKVKVRESLPAVDVALPVSFQVPVDWQVPVKAKVPVNMSLLVSGQLRHEMTVPLKASWVLHPVIDTQLKAAVQGQTTFALQTDALHLPVMIERARVRLPFNLAVQAAP
ncbi:MAG: hypothetical protein RI907_4023 [Pseudomonadota bacterium]|jgi:hypothetical protein